MRAQIIDPALRSRGGHHYNAVRRLQDELSKLDIGYACLGSAYADHDVVRELGCIPSFTRSVYGRDYTDPGEFARDVAETSRQLAQALHRQGGPADLLILPCCDQILASAVAQHLKRRRGASVPHIVLWLLYGPHYKTATDDPLVAGLSAECRDAFAALKTSVGDERRLRAHCETPAMAAFYHALLDLDVQVMSGPGLVLAGRSVRRGGPGHSPTVVSLGFANRSKGYRLLPDAVEHVLQHHRHARFLIHGIVVGSDAQNEQSAFDRLSTLGERVVVRQDVLTAEGYAAWLGQADLLLLPYDPNVYRSRGSGVFTEAQRLGIPVVAPQGCAFATPAFDGGWGVEITDYSSFGVARAVLAALGRLDALSSQAAIAAHRTDDTLACLLQATVGAVRADRPATFAGRVRRLIRRNF